MKEIQKRFPAETTMERSTFLNNKEIDGLLYAYFQNLSRPVCIDEENKIYETRVDKAYIPSQIELCKQVRIKSTSTLRKRMGVLLNTGYLIDKGEYYVLPQVEEQYLGIPLETLKFFVDTLKVDVVKVYIYLGQRYKYAQSIHTLYSFDKEEILTHLGRSAGKSGYEFVNHALDALINNGLIRVVEFRDGKKPCMRLVEFNTTYKQNLL